MFNQIKKGLNKIIALNDLLYSLIAIFFALLIGAVFIIFAGYNVLDAYRSMFVGAFGDLYSFAQTMRETIPLIFTGLAVAIGFKSGFFNIGGEGQLYWGALMTAVVAVSFPNLNSFLLIPLCLIAGALAGGIWGGIPGYLKAKTGAHIVVTTMMFNYIAIFGTTFLVKNFFNDPGPVDQTVRLSENALLTEIIPFTRFTTAIFIALFVIIIIDFIYKKTSIGYDLKAVGENSAAAEYAGIDSQKMIVLSMFISGAVAGLAGSTMVMGVLGRFITNFSADYGYAGIAIAVLGKNKPWGIFFSALLFGILESGGSMMQLTEGIPSDVILVIQGLVILLVSAPLLINLILKHIPNLNSNARGDNIG